jgi:hypothetical protein
MRNDQIFVLLLVILLPMSGCFDGAVGDAEGTDDATDGTTDGTTVINNYHNGSSGSQDRDWHTMGDIVSSRWTDGSDVSPNSQRCLEYGPSYDPDDGSYLGEECKRTGIPESEEDWDTTNCTGTITVGYTNTWGVPNWGYGPNCEDIEFASITTNSGEALIIRELTGMYVSSTCDGYTFWSSTNWDYGTELTVAGSALNCTHSLVYSQSYSTVDSDYVSSVMLLSLVYTIEDMTVVTA